MTMEKITNLILLFSGLSSLCANSLPHYNYALIRTPKTWYDAQSFCRKNCVDLATIGNISIMEAALKLVEGQYNATWMGLQKGGQQLWYFTMLGYDFFVVDPSFHMYWRGQTNYPCGYYESGYLSTSPCSSALYSICFDVTKQGQDQYILSTAKMSWTTAQEYCRTNYTELVNIRNLAEQQIIDQLANGQQIWVGVFIDDWVWSDQTYPGFRYWPVDDYVWSAPSGYCGALLQNESGRWRASLCSEQRPFICECSGVNLKFIKVKISSDSVLYLNKPAVQNDILTKIRLRLLSEIKTDAFQLQWRKQPDGKVFMKEKLLDP